VSESTASQSPVGKSPSFSCSSSHPRALIAETAVEVDEADCFATTDLVLHRDFAAPPASGPILTSPPTSMSVS
jgi:hypothetical protein